MDLGIKDKRVLVTGASGVLGSNLAFFYKARYHVVGVYRHNFMDLQNVRMVQADLSSGDQVDRLIDRHDPDVVIHCAAIPDIDRCEMDPAETYRQNVLTVKNFVRSLQGRGIKFVLLSTDNVYNANGGHTEDELGPPVNEYGRSKLRGEKAALSLKDAVVLRTTFFGCGNCCRKTHSEQMILSLLRGEKFKGFDDVFFSPIYVFDLSEIIEQVFRKDLNGIYNVGSSNGTSKFALLRQIALSLGLNTDLIEPISVDSLSLTAARNKNAVMNVSRISAALGVKMPDVTQTAARFADDLRRGVIPEGSILENGILCRSSKLL